MSGLAAAPTNQATSPFENFAEVQADLAFLEHLKSGKKAFFEELCSASREQTNVVLSVLRMEATYTISEFFYLIRAHGIETATQLRRLAELHNQYISELLEDKKRMTRFGLSADRLLDSIFTGDTMPRLVEQWAKLPGSLDQSNLARFLVTLMSSETCRKIVVACDQAGFLHRRKTRSGTIVVSSGTLELFVAQYVRAVRYAVAFNAKSAPA